MQTVTTTDTSTPRLYRWTRQEVERLAELGAFEGVHVELIEGQIVEMSPNGPRHTGLTNRGRKALERAFPADRYTVRPEAPLALSDWSAPEPDMLVAVGGDADYMTAHPTAAQAALVVEVADSSIAYDRGYKADLYAAAGIRDYWVVDVSAGVVVVLRAPRPDETSRTGQRYAERHDYRSGEQIAPLAAGAAPVTVAELLP
ncbi:MAG: Uma2 family endonuclease [Chloroflexi bacterium]|nr:Uma2 family endonuclease [Chloroflexota bacterium]